MAFFQIGNVNIDGISACVPNNLVETSSMEIFNKKEAQVFTQNTGIKQRYTSKGNICASDLCLQAAEKIIEKLDWKKEEINLLIFVSQTPDYILPATSNLIQSRLNLTNECYCLDISLGCSGYIYGLSTVASLMQTGNFTKALLLVGDTISNLTSSEDKSVHSLFGDAGTATALTFDNNKLTKWAFNMGSDGTGFNAINIKDGGARNKLNFSSFTKKFIDFEDESKGRMNNLNLKLSGIDVFNFGIKIAPKSINDLLQKIGVSIETINYLFLHQANLFMNETIRKKLKIDKDKVPSSIENYGNTSGASIPLTIVQTFLNKNFNHELFIIMCGFGVGLSWGSVFLKLDKLFKTNMSFYDVK